jgi:hypothetical protein
MRLQGLDEVRSDFPHTRPVDAGFLQVSSVNYDKQCKKKLLSLDVVCEQKGVCYPIVPQIAALKLGHDFQ